MSVHIDHAHHHPKVYRRLGYWQARCPRCGLLCLSDRDPSFREWGVAYLVALYHAKEAHS